MKNENNNSMIPVWMLLVLLSISFPIADATTSSLKHKAVCYGHRVGIPTTSARAWLPLNHRHGPCSPSPSSDSERRLPSTADVLRGHHLRTASIRSDMLNGSSAAAAASKSKSKLGDVTVPTRLGTPLNTLEYVVTLGLGTPAVTQTVFIDTGSDVPWVQCRPCPVPPCHPQKDAVFDPARSATYSAISCSSAACLALGRAASNNGCSSAGSSSTSTCQYIVKYGDGSNTTGTYISDELAVAPDYTVHGFRFGCSHAVTELLSTMQADGLLALGGGAPSLVTQTAEKAFSYCLPPTETHSGFLTLGVPRASASRFAVTPMHGVGGGAKTYYGVRLQGIAVAGRRLDIPSSVFSAGSVLDSGTVITELPLTAYRALQAAFTEEMSMYPSAAPANGFDTCFDLTGGGGGGGGDVKLPSVALVFDRGAAVELDASGILYDGCLAFFTTGDDTSFGIIGNVQQRTFEVLYDIGGQAVGFRPGAC